jgi:hypothetical protein
MTENISWNCQRISRERNVGIAGMGIFLFGLFLTFAVLVLFVALISTTGLAPADIDFGERLALYFNPYENPFIWVIISIFGLSIIFLSISKGVRNVCLKK